MASGTISLGQKGAIIGQIVWTSSSNGTTANSSNVTATIQVKKSSNTTQPTSGTWTGNLNIGGDNRQISTKQSVGTSWVTLLSFTKVQTHNTDGSGACYIQGAINGPAGTSQAGNTVSGSQTVTLDNIARQATITSAQNFTDIQNPTIQYTNPLGNTATSLQACISLTGSTDDIQYRDIDKNGTSYTFNLTNAERNVLRQATPNSNTLNVKFYVKTVVSGNTYYSILDKTMTIVNANPTFSMAYKDTNATTTGLTGNNQLIIQSNSTLQINISNAKALKYATLSSISLNVNGNITSQSLSSSSLTLNIGKLDVSQNLQIPITITDSRGNTTTNTLEIQVLEWSLPNAIIELARVSNYYTTTNLLVNAQYSSLNDKNDITIQYQIKKVSESTYGAVTTISNNTQVQFDADNLYEWNVKVILTDKIGSNSYILKLNKGIPIVYFDDKLMSTGFNCFPRSENGVWSQDWPIDDIIFLGSQSLYDKYTSNSTEKTAVIGAYGYGLINGMFTGIKIPSAYERAYRITAQVSSTGGDPASVWLNNFQSNQISTWSGASFRNIVSTRIFKESEITLEQTINYTNPGCNLYINNVGNNEANFWNITVHCYLVKKTTNLEQVGSYALTSADNAGLG